MDICNLTGKMINIFYDYYKNLNLDKTINITGMNGDHIVLDKTLKVFALKLEGDSNYQQNLTGIEQIRSSFMFSEEISRMMVTIVKTENYQGSYIFCTNEDMALSFKELFNIELLKDSQIINSLFDSYLINDYYIGENKRFKSSVSVDVDKEYFKDELEIDPEKPIIPIEFDLLYYKGKEIIKEATSSLLENYEVFQGYRFKQKKQIQFSSLYKADWKGVIYLYFDFSHASSFALARTYKEKTRDEGGKAHEYAQKLYEAVENKDLDVCVANCMLVIKNSRDVALVSNQLGIDFIKKNIGNSEILSKTLLLKRDVEKNSLILTKDIERFVAKVHKRDSIAEIEGKKVDIDFYGYDVNHAYVNYIFREQDNPHCLLIAGSGSGKSVALQKIICLITDFNAKTLEAKRISDTQTRYFDVGLSGKKLIETLKIKNGDVIQELSPSVNEMRFNMIDIATSDDGVRLDMDDLIFKLSIFDLALESNNSDVLTAEEYSIIKDGIVNMYENDIYERITIHAMKKKGFTLIARKLEEFGYSEYTSIDDIEPEHSHLVKNIKKPTLHQLESLLMTKSKDVTLSEAVKISMDGAIKKVMAINSLEIFSQHALFSNFGESGFVYFDVDKIKSNPRLFPPIYMYVLMSFYNYDKEQANDIRFKRKKRKFSEIPQSMYYVEEAHNFMRFKSFQRIFEILAREARKFGVHMFFISQNYNDINKETIRSISTRMFLAKEGKVGELVQSIKEHTGIDEEVEWLFNRLEPYQLLVNSDKGAFGCKLEITKEEISIFSTAT